MKPILNPDKEVVAFVREGLKARGGYCPCRVEKIEENRCLCQEFRETGHCCCGLYVGKE